MRTSDPGDRGPERDLRRGPSPLGARSAAEGSGLEALGQVTAELLHDLSNLISVIAGRATLLRDSSRTGHPDSVQEADSLLDDCRELQRMMEDVLRELRAPQRSPEISFLPGELAELEVTRWVRAAPAIGVELVSTLPAGARVEGPSTFFSRSFRNLLGNASRFAHSRIRARLDLIHDGAGALWITVEVEDDGPGVSPGLGERIFEPLHRGDESRYPGSGLGLSLVRWAVARLGGEISVGRSAELGGARFRMQLPLARRIGSRPRDQAVPTSPLAGVLVALVEDEAAVRDVQTRLLQRAGAGVHPVLPERTGDPHGVAREIVDSKADLVILDLKLGRFGGREVWEALHEISPSLAYRTIFLTGDIPSGSVPERREPALERTGRPVDVPVLAKALAWPLLLAELAETMKRMGIHPRRGPSTPPEAPDASSAGDP